MIIPKWFRKKERDPRVLVNDLNEDIFCLPCETDVEHTFLHYNNEQNQMGSLCLGDIILNETSQAQEGKFWQFCQGLERECFVRWAGIG